MLRCEKPKAPSNPSSSLYPFPPLPGNRFPSMDSNRGCRRASMKAHSINWKDKLRKNCLERAHNERSLLIWKIRFTAQARDQKEIVRLALRDMVSDELKKIRDSSLNNDDDSSLWEYDGMDIESSSSEYEQEDVLLEMEKLLYDDLKKELVRRALSDYEEEEEYLARAVHEQLNINDDKISRVWCPVCKQGELSENRHLICCTRCSFQLDVEGDKVNLSVLRTRLAEVYEDHLVNGCKASPTFCMEARFNITALYIRCHVCNIFDVVL